MSYAENLQKVAKVLKERFPNLSVTETIELSGKILDCLIVE